MNTDEFGALMTPPTEIEVSNFDQLLSVLLGYESNWMFRGQQAASWELTSTLERLLGPLARLPGVSERCEQLAFHRFESQAHHYLTKDYLPETRLGMLALMQHHGVPTRLLDFTTSPFVALFFALNGVSSSQGEPCAVWALDYRDIVKGTWSQVRQQFDGLSLEYTEIMSIQDEIYEKYIEPGVIERLWITEPKTFNSRLERQKGTFLLSTRPGRTISDLVCETLTTEAVHKIVLPAKFRQQTLRTLRSMGLDNSRLFGDVDGLARDLRDELRLQIEAINERLGEAGGEATPSSDHP